MTQTQLQTFSFHGNNLTTFKIDDVPYVAMRPIVESMGLSWSTQVGKINAQTGKFNCVHMNTVGADGKSREMLSMPVQKLPLWLASINPNKIKNADKRQMIELFQEESAQALWSYWNTGIAVKDDHEGIITELDPKVMQALGGMMKGIVNKTIRELVPGLVEGKLMEQKYLLRSGKTAKQIWDAHDLPQKLKGSSSWFGNRLKEMGCSIENEGRADRGSYSIRLFDPDKANICMRNGLKHRSKAYAEERKGQSKMNLVLLKGGVK